MKDGNTLRRVTRLYLMRIKLHFNRTPAVSDQPSIPGGATPIERNNPWLTFNKIHRICKRAQWSRATDSCYLDYSHREASALSRIDKLDPSTPIPIATIYTLPT